MTKISDRLGYVSPFGEKSLFNDNLDGNSQDSNVLEVNRNLDEFTINSAYYDSLFNENLGLEFPAGRVRKDHPGAYGHGDIEDLALGKKYDDDNAELFNQDQIDQIYLGNWLRDFSQMIVGAIVKGKNFYNNQIITDDFYSEYVNDLLALRHKKIEHDTLVELVKIAAVKEFIYDPLVEEAENKKEQSPRNNYAEYEKKFEATFNDITVNSLGIYRPEEHIDNPKRLEDESALGVNFIYEYMTKTDSSPIKKVVFLYNGETKPILQNEVGESFEITKGQDTTKNKFPPNNFKKFIVEDILAEEKGKYQQDYENERTLVKALRDDEVSKKENKADYDEELLKVVLTQDKKQYGKRSSAVTYMLEQFRLAAYYGKNKKGFMHFGAALHILEDFFAHSNFCELTLIKYDRPKTHAFVVILDEDILTQQKERGPKVNDFPLVTGLFDIDDTAVSIVPKLVESLFSLKIEDYKRRQIGDKTFTEAFLEKILQDRADEEKSILNDDSKSKQEKQKLIDELTVESPDLPIFGKIRRTPSELLSDFETVLGWLDDWVEATTIKKDDNFIVRGFKYSLQNFSKFIFHIMEIIGFYISSILRPILDEFPNAVIASQEVSNENYGEQGNDPTHSQVAKDHPEHHLNTLAGELAVAAVREVGSIMKAIWDGKHNVTLKYLEDKVTNKYIQHPADTDWMKKLVEEWIDNHSEEVERAEYKNALAYTEALGNKALERFKHEHTKFSDWLEQKIKDLEELKKQ